MSMQILMLRNRMVNGVLLASGSTQTVADSDGAYLVASGWATRVDGVPDRVITGSVDVPTIDSTTGALGNPLIGALTVPCALSPMMTVWSLRITSADSADTVTVYETIGGVESSIGTLSVPAGDSISDSYQKQFGATYRCTQAGSATLTAEVM